MLGRTLLTTTAVAAVTVILTAAAMAADGPAEDGNGAQVSSYLHTVAPSVIGPGDELVLAGTVENTGDEPLANVQVLPRWSDIQLETREEVHRVSTDSSLRWGFRRDNPYQVVDEVLEPGERREFELRFDNVDQFGFGLPGVYAVGVDIRGSLPDGERVTLDTVRTILPWLPGDEPQHIEMALMWPVEAPPSLLPDGALRDETVARRIADGGALDALLDAAGTAPVTWVVDPDVMDTVETMADGYDTGLDPDDRSSGEAADAASAWLSEFDDTTGDATVSLTPYARPDVESLMATEPRLADSFMRQAVERSRSAANDSGRSRVTWIGGPWTTDDVLATVAGSGVDTAVLPAGTVSVPDSQPFGVAGTAAGDLDVVVTDAGLSSAIVDAYTAASPEAGALDLRQRWTADTAMLALEAAALGVEAPSVVVAPPARWTPNPEVASAVVDAWTSVPWIEPVSFDDLRRPAQPATVTVTPSDAVNPLATDNAAAAGELSAAVQDYTDILADPDAELTDALALATIRATSVAWRDDPAAGAEYAAAMTRELSQQLREVRLTVPESVTLSSRTGVFPLTITNELDHAVTVKLAIRAANPDRLRVDDVAEQVIEAGSRTTIEIRAEAATNGRVPITVQLVTNNDSPLGPARQTVVNATDYGTIGWVIIAGAAAVFGFSILRTMMRRRREPHDPDEPPGGTDEQTEAELDPDHTHLSAPTPEASR